MYPQQPGQQPPYPPQQGPTPPPQPGQSDSQSYPTQQPQQEPAPVDPWQMQPQPTPQPTAQPWPDQRTGTYNEPDVPLTPNGIAPIDYLEQIAPKQKASFGFSRKQVAILGAVILVGFIGFAAAAILQSGKPNIGAVSRQLTMRVGATSTIAKDAQKNLRSRDLHALNTSLTIQLANTNTGLATAFAEAGVIVGEIKDAKTDDTSAETIKKLDDARLNGVFDRVYAREMSFRLSTILTHLDSIHKSTKNTKLREYLETTYKNLEPLQKQLAEYSASSS